jgi:hypothetical protein
MSKKHMSKKQKARHTSYTADTANNSNKEKPVMKTSIWTRIKTWVSGTTKKVVAFARSLFTRTRTALRTATKAIRNSRTFKAVTFAIPSVRKFLHNVMALFTLVAGVSGLAVAPVTTVAIFAGAFLGFHGLAFLVGKLDEAARRGARWANVVHDILDVVARAVVYTAEAFTAYVVVVTVATAPSVAAVILTFAAVFPIVIEIGMRAQAANYQERVDAAMGAQDDEDRFYEDMSEESDPFGPASVR